MTGIKFMYLLSFVVVDCTVACIKLFLFYFFCVYCPSSLGEVGLQYIVINKYERPTNLPIMISQPNADTEKTLKTNGH